MGKINFKKSYNDDVLVIDFKIESIIEDIIRDYAKRINDIDGHISLGRLQELPSLIEEKIKQINFE